MDGLFHSDASSGLAYGQICSPSQFGRMFQQSLFLGLDIGSTTIKAVALDGFAQPVHTRYLRHYSHIRSCLQEMLAELAAFCQDSQISCCLTGSAALDLAKELDIPFIQEVLACTIAIEKRIPDADVIIELGGEDAKLTYLSGGIEQRMNETCAGGTGAFIDQMAAFIGTDAAGLNKLAMDARAIYPIASRCGVFAKSDILPLLNEGCRKEDIAASIMQAVVNQTISGLAQGRPITGKTVFLGGPLHFLPALGARFRQSLKNIREAVFPPDGHFFVALGAALHSMPEKRGSFALDRVISRLAKASPQKVSRRLKPLFESREDLETFRTRHSQNKLPQIALEEAAGPAWLGVDSGSTTIKAVLIDENGRLLYSWYESSHGEPLKAFLRILRQIYARKNPGLRICGSCATGYGSALLAAALRLDADEVETVAHCAAAAHFDPKVSFILDIGGQDIKCMRVKAGVISQISLNEACSAGCGSFIENFSESLDMPLPEFVQAALRAPAPVDLGTRCTVFMNSKVRQAQKEGADICDIAAGLCWSVVRNAIFKVMKIADTKSLGDHIVAQGGAFLNDAILRALELELDVNVVRPPLPGLMGAFGAALVAKSRFSARHVSSIRTDDELTAFRLASKTRRCGGCANACLLTVSTFGENEKFISGNRCEKGAGAKARKLPNVSAFKYKCLFEREPLPACDAWRGSIGIPRALNMFENYPLWFTLLTKLGYRVELSDPASREAYCSAHDTIPSQTVCYPAKLAHAYIINLLERGVKTIFFPCIQHEQKDADFLHGVYNCPVVAGYPETLALNIGALSQAGVNYIHDFVPLDKNLLAKSLIKIPFFAKIPEAEMEAAVAAGFEEMEHFRKKIRQAGEQALAELRQTGNMGLIVASHPYHVDPAINHGIAELINSCGLGVLTEDSIAHLMPDPGELRIVDQWAYHSRLYRAGAFAGQSNNLAVLQLISFGCGLDALTSDQLEEIVVRNDRLYAQIKIDEGMNLGGARIRIRSLLAAMRKKQDALKNTGISSCRKTATTYEEWPRFSPEMKNTHTLLVPQMSPLHFQFAPQIFGAEGYTAELLPHVDQNAINLGLRHVNNDACYPAIVLIGQLLQAVQSGKYDPAKIALVISQTGGGCRATNYVSLLRKALVETGLGNVPIINFSANIHGPGLKLSFRLISRLVMAGHYGDALMRVSHRLRPYELEKGSTHALVEKWSALAAQNIESGNLARFQANMFAMIREFDQLPLQTEMRRPRIGLVGEILLKYHPDANNHAATIIEEEGGEAVVTDIMDFMLYSLYDHIFNYENLDGDKKNAMLAKAAIAWQRLTRTALNLALGRSKRFDRPTRFADLKKNARKIISFGHQSGEGWLLGAEMIRMLESGVSGILCMQPFGCLPNHIVGKGLIRELKTRYPQTAIMALDYDPGASETNQINRIKLMMRSGLKNTPNL